MIKVMVWGDILMGHFMSAYKHMCARAHTHTEE